MKIPPQDQSLIQEQVEDMRCRLKENGYITEAQYTISEGKLLSVKILFISRCD